MTILVERLPEVVVEGKRLGRHVRIDARSKSYRVRPRTAQAIESKMWFGSNKYALDQKDVGACCGFSAAHVLNCEPWGMHLSNADALDIYAAATALDEYEGTWPDMDTGSSLLGTMKACRDLGYIKSWQNAYSIDDVLSGLQTGPGQFGITWFDGCDDPDWRDGRISPTGAVRGGHAIAIVGCDLSNGTIILRNSWGNLYGVEHTGQTGYFRLSLIEFEALLNMTGEAVFPTPL